MHISLRLLSRFYYDYYGVYKECLTANHNPLIIVGRSTIGTLNDALIVFGMNEI